MYRLITPALIAVSVAALSSQQASAQDPRCAYSSLAHNGDIVINDNCGVLPLPDGTGPYLLDAIADDIRFDDDGLACIRGFSDNAFLLHRDGQWASVELIEASCPWFEEGLTIASVEGRPVYVDKTLAVVLDPGYDSLWLFEQGYASVCNGPFVYERNGEKMRRTGGTCGLIDMSGQFVVDMLPVQESGRAFTDYRNSHNECLPPPIETEASALCHGQRHARVSNVRSDWHEYTIEHGDGYWVVSTVTRAGIDYTFYIGADKADSITAMRSEHRERFELISLPGMLERWRSLQ